MAKAASGDGDIDGRTRRALRSREAIAGALFELVGEGFLQPTAQQVAERAGVGIRTVFRHFDDMDGLYALMNQRIESDASALLFGGEPDGSVGDRCRDLVARRFALFEKVGPYKRCGNLYRWRSDFLQTTHARLQRALRADLLRWLPELAAAPDEVTAAFDAACSFEVWDRLRGDLRLGRERARGVVDCTVEALAATYLNEGDPLR